MCLCEAFAMVCLRTVLFIAFFLQCHHVSFPVPYAAVLSIHHQQFGRVALQKLNKCVTTDRRIVLLLTFCDSPTPSPPTRYRPTTSCHRQS